MELMTDGERKIVVRYSAASNISFRGTAELDVTRAEWAEMTVEQQNIEIEDFLFELVDVEVVDDPGTAAP